MWGGGLRDKAAVQAHIRPTPVQKDHTVFSPLLRSVPLTADGSY